MQPHSSLFPDLANRNSVVAGIGKFGKMTTRFARTVGGLAIKPITFALKPLTNLVARPLSAMWAAAAEVADSDIVFVKRKEAFGAASFPFDRFLQERQAKLDAAERSLADGNASETEAMPPAPDDYPAHPVVPMDYAGILFDLGLEAAGLRWTLPVAKHLRPLVGDITETFVDALLDETLCEVLNDEQWGIHLRQLRETLWPDGMWPESFPEASPEEKQQLRQEAKVCLMEFLPRWMPIVLGQRWFERAAGNALACLAFPALNRHLMLHLVDCIAAHFRESDGDGR